MTLGQGTRWSDKVEGKLPAVKQYSVQDSGGEILKLYL